MPRHSKRNGRKLIESEIDANFQAILRTKADASGASNEKLRIILLELATKEIPTHGIAPPTPSDLTTVKFVLASFSAICHVSKRAIAYHTPFPSGPSGTWPVIWSWWEYIRQYCIDEKKYGTLVEEIAVTELVSMSRLLTMDDGLISVVCDTPGFMYSSFRLWMQEEHYYNKYPNTQPPGFRPFTMLFTDLVRRCPDNRTFNATFEETGMTPDTLCSYAVKYLDFALNPLQLEHATALIMLIVLLCSQNKKLLWAFLRNDTVAVITRGFLASVTCKQKTGMATVVDDCFLFYSYWMDSRIGSSWIIQAIDAGFLQAMAALSLEQSILNTKRLHKACRIFDVFGTHLVSRTVLQSVSGPIEEVKQSRASNVHSVAPMLAPRWEAFIWTATQRLQLLKGSGLADLAPRKLLSCKNSKCTTRGPDENPSKTKLSRCTGCYSVHFCSKECQRAEWPDHRLYCQRMRDTLTELGIRPDPKVMVSELAFWVTLMAFTFDHLRKEIVEQILELDGGEKICSREALSSVFVGFDFQLFPEEVIVSKELPFSRSPDSGAKYMTPQREDERRQLSMQTLKAVAESKGRLMVVQARTPALAPWNTEVDACAMPIEANFIKCFEDALRKRGHDVPDMPLPSPTDDFPIPIEFVY